MAFLIKNVAQSGFTGRLPMPFRLLSFFPPMFALMLAPASTRGEDAPVLVKVRLRTGRTVVGELREASAAQVKLLDLKTGKEATYFQADVSKIERDPPDNEVTGAVGLPVYVAWKLSREFGTLAVGKIADVKPTAIYVTLGTKAGIEKGQKLTVYRDDGEVKDPDTGEVLERQRARIAEIEVTEAREKFSKAKLLGDLEVQLRTGDEVETAQESNAIAVLPPVDADGNRTTAGEKLAEELTTEMVARGLKVVERTLLDKTLGELELQRRGLFEDSNAREVGRQLKAYAIMTGRQVQNGRVINTHVRLIKVDTGEVLLAASQKKTGSLGDVVGEGGPKASAGGDLLGRIELTAHARSNNVRAAGDSIVIGPQSALSIPLTETGNYELEIGFVRTSGSDALVGVLPIGKGHFMFGLSQEYGRQHTVMSAARQPGRLQNGKDHTVRFVIKQRGAAGEVEMFLDDQSVLKTDVAIVPLDHEWAGISPDWGPAIKSQNATYEIRSLAVKRLR